MLERVKMGVHKQGKILVESRGKVCYQLQKPKITCWQLQKLNITYGQNQIQNLLTKYIILVLSIPPYWIVTTQMDPTWAVAHIEGVPIAIQNQQCVQREICLHMNCLHSISHWDWTFIHTYIHVHLGSGALGAHAARLHQSKQSGLCELFEWIMRWNSSP